MPSEGRRQAHVLILAQLWQQALRPRRPEHWALSSGTSSLVSMYTGWLRLLSCFVFELSTASKRVLLLIYWMLSSWFSIYFLVHQLFLFSYNFYEISCFRIYVLLFNLPASLSLLFSNKSAMLRMMNSNMNILNVSNVIVVDNWLLVSIASDRRARLRSVISFSLHSSILSFLLSFWVVTISFNLLKFYLSSCKFSSQKSFIWLLFFHNLSYDSMLFLKLFFDKLFVEKPCLRICHSWSIMSVKKALLWLSLSKLGLAHFLVLLKFTFHLLQLPQLSSHVQEVSVQNCWICLRDVKAFFFSAQNLIILLRLLVILEIFFFVSFLIWPMIVTFAVYRKRRRHASSRHLLTAIDLALHGCQLFFGIGDFGGLLAGLWELEQIAIALSFSLHCSLQLKQTRLDSVALRASCLDLGSASLWSRSWSVMCECSCALPHSLLNASPLALLCVALLAAEEEHIKSLLPALPPTCHLSPFRLLSPVSLHIICSYYSWDTPFNRWDQKSSQS